MKNTKRDEIKSIISSLLYHNLLALGTTLDLVAEMNSRTTLGASVEAVKNTLTAPAACDGHIC